MPASDRRTDRQTESLVVAIDRVSCNACSAVKPARDRISVSKSHACFRLVPISVILKRSKAEYRALRNADVQLCCVRLMLAHLDKMLAATEIGAQPVQRRVSQSELGPQALD